MFDFKTDQTVVHYIHIDLNVFAGVNNVNVIITKVLLFLWISADVNSFYGYPDIVLFLVSDTNINPWKKQIRANFSCDVLLHNLQEIFLAASNHWNHSAEAQTTPADDIIRRSREK